MLFEVQLAFGASWQLSAKWEHYYCILYLRRVQHKWLHSSKLRKYQNQSLKLGQTIVCTSTCT